ncbi:MAG: lipoyl synthase [Candidatus Omnitrophota bacterium]|nr:MAG: lipoyl synthase [Candidatus Omnitrophota bacterium]
MCKKKQIYRKPKWLNKKINLQDCVKLNSLFKDLQLNTICTQAKCPNISECFASGVATFLILGKICTRNCKFCAVAKGKPEKLDLTEPERIAHAVKLLGLKHVVITSVTRDDLTDGGAEIFSQNVQAIHQLNESIRVEILVPDFNGNMQALKKVIFAEPDIFAHNIETVPRLYGKLRNALYSRSLGILNTAKEINNKLYTKSGLMLGLGEKQEEVIDVLKDLRKVRCDFLSLGQYLSPGYSYFPVQEYIRPEHFTEYKKIAESLGFLHIKSGPYVRSSYLSASYIP